MKISERKSGDKNPVSEWPGLVVVKFVCVAVMIFVHAHMMLITNASYAITDTAGFFYRMTSDYMFVGSFVFMLPILAGAVFRMNLGKVLDRDRMKKYGIMRVVRLATFLSVVGFFMNVLVGGIWAVFSWNILQLMGVSLVVIALLVRFFPIRVVSAVGMAVLFAAEPLRSLLGGLNDSYPIAILIGNGNGFVFWPFFPWFGVIVFGFLFAHLYLKHGNGVAFERGAIGAGAILLATAILRGEISPYLDPKYVFGPSVFQPKIGFVFATTGLFCILIVLSDRFFRNVGFGRYGVVNSYSKGIIWIYVVQMVANLKLSSFIKARFPISEPSIAYLVTPVTVLLLCWLVGALSIRLLQEKRIVISFRKTYAT